MEDALRRQLYSAITKNDVATATQILSSDPEALNDTSLSGRWIHLACKKSELRVVQAILELGADVNSCCMPEEETPLTSAVHRARPDVVRFLLERGATPNVGRPIIGAINLDDESVGLEIVRLLVEFGADVNAIFNWMGDDDVTICPLEWAEDSERHSIAEFLRSRGAVRD